MIAMQGTGVSAGVASGPIRFYRRKKSTVKRVTVEDAQAEVERYRAASEKAVEQLGVLAEKARKEAGDESASLFETHQMMLEDLDYVAAITDLIEQEHVNADYAVHETGSQFAEMFSAMEDEYMRARIADVLDISGRLERVLRGEEAERNDDAIPAIPDFPRAPDKSDAYVYDPKTVLQRQHAWVKRCAAIVDETLIPWLNGRLPRLMALFEADMVRWFGPEILVTPDGKDSSP